MSVTDVKTNDARAVFVPDQAADTALTASFHRLMAKDYDVEAVIAESIASDWPGDVAGRLLLSLCRLWRSGYPTQERARALFAAMLGAMDETGYFGPRLGDVVDEQQIACSGWVVSGLLQYFHLTGDPAAERAALRLVDELLLPALDRLPAYPRDRKVREAGAPSGTLTEAADGWLLSSDTWCVFLTLNGLVPAFTVSGRADIRTAIEGLRDLVVSIDARAQRAQLHAVLSAARALAQFTEETGDPRSRQLAIDVYDLYAEHGRTLNFATWNWFERPDSWTEPCAITDSLGLALALWRLTGMRRYAADARLIELNALGFAQRADGSFGLDSVTTPDAPLLWPLHADARWCCTMRGALGLAEARDGSVSYDAGSGALTVLTARPGVVVVSTPDGEWAVRQDVEGETPDHVMLTVEKAPRGRSLRVVLPSASWSPWRPATEAPDAEISVTAATAAVTLEGRVGMRASIRCDAVEWEHRHANGRATHLRGPLVLTTRAPAGEADGAHGFPGVGHARPVDGVDNAIPPAGEAPRYRLAFDV